MVDEEDQWKILDKQPLNVLIVTSWVTLQKIVDNQERRRLENCHHLMNVLLVVKQVIGVENAQIKNHMKSRRKHLNGKENPRKDLRSIRGLTQSNSMKKRQQIFI